MKNIYGNLLRMMSFGESHGPAMGVVVDGMPSETPWDQRVIERELKRRRPMQLLGSGRREPDSIEILSGVWNGRTLGTPIACLVRNLDQRSEDYQDKPQRRGHADDLWKDKYAHSDWRGGGRASGRETVSRVIGGSIAFMFLKTVCPAYRCFGFLSQVGELSLESTQSVEDWAQSHNQEIRDDDLSLGFPDKGFGKGVRDLLENARQKGESLGGIIEVWIEGIPKGVGQPVFHKLKNELAQGILSIGAVNSFEFGAGLSAVSTPGTRFHNEVPTSVYGGIRGGLSTGERICLRVGFKPTSTVKDMAKKGRHDPCIAIRALPVVEAMIHFTLADHVLWSRMDRL